MGCNQSKAVKIIPPTLEPPVLIPVSAPTSFDVAVTPVVESQEGAIAIPPPVSIPTESDEDDHAASFLDPMDNGVHRNTTNSNVTRLPESFSFSFIEVGSDTHSQKSVVAAAAIACIEETAVEAVQVEQAVVAVEDEKASAAVVDVECASGLPETVAEPTQELHVVDDVVVECVVEDVQVAMEKIVASIEGEVAEEVTATEAEGEEVLVPVEAVTTVDVAEVDCVVEVEQVQVEEVVTQVVDVQEAVVVQEVSVDDAVVEVVVTGTTADALDDAVEKPVLTAGEEVVSAEVVVEAEPVIVSVEAVDDVNEIVADLIASAVVEPPLIGQEVVNVVDKVVVPVQVVETDVVTKPEEKEDQEEPDMEASVSIEPTKPSTYRISGTTTDNGIVMYLIQQTDGTNGKWPIPVSKRYTEFAYLHSKLVSSHLRHSMTLPSLPQAGFVSYLRGRQHKRTIQQRQEQFDTLLQYIASHPELANSPIFQSFLNI